MGVMPCNRTGCQNIMCDRWSHDYGYICEQCFDELVGIGPLLSVDQFMTTPKESTALLRPDMRPILEKIFPSTRTPGE